MDSLKAMFPELDEDTLGAVLASCNQNVESAVEVLLNMATEQVAPTQPEPGIDGSTEHVNLQADIGLMASQIAQDEEIARQLQQQLLLEEEDEQMRLRLLQREQMEQQQLFGSSYPGQHAGLGGYPGAPPVPYAGQGGYHPNVHRPASWGASGQPPAQREDDSGGLGSGLYSAGSSVASAVGSLWNWATAADEPEERRPAARAPAQGGGEPREREMQVTRRGPSREFDGPRIVSVAGDEGARDELAMYDVVADRGSPQLGHEGSDTQVVRGDEGYAGGSGGEVRRRVRHASTAGAEHHDIL